MFTSPLETLSDTVRTPTRTIEYIEYDGCIYDMNN